MKFTIEFPLIILFHAFCSNFYFLFCFFIVKGETGVVSCEVIFSLFFFTLFFMKINKWPVWIFLEDHFSFSKNFFKIHTLITWILETNYIKFITRIWNFVFKLLIKRMIFNIFKFTIHLFNYMIIDLNTLLKGWHLRPRFVLRDALSHICGLVWLQW